MRPTRSLAACFALSMLSAVSAGAQTVPLGDSSLTTTLTAVVSEQATVTVPGTITFNVTNVTASTTATASVSVSNIVLSSAAKQIHVSLKADTASFNPPAPGDATWAAGDVSWNAATWTNASGTSGTLDDVGFNDVSACTADTASCSTNDLTFTLAPNLAVKRAGSHSIVVRWKVDATL
jgi:hypothetical protein